jgi:uncharacterized protein (TIGR02597 family)
MRHLLYPLLALAASAGIASAQATSYTTPVGYLTLTTPANSDASLSIPLARQPAVTTAVTAAVSAATITVKGSGIAANQFQYADGSQDDTFMARFTSGGEVGRYYTVISNTASSDAGTPLDPADDTFTITLDSSVTVAVDDSVSITPYWSLNTLFPGGDGVGTSADPFNPTAFVLFQDQVGTGANRAPDKLFFYFDDGANGPDNGWYENGNLGAGKQDDLVLNPDDLFLIRNSTGTPVELTVSGEIPVVGHKTDLIIAAVVNDNYIAQPFPVDVTLAQSNLQQSGALAGSSDPFNPTDFVLVYDDAAAGFNKAASTIYFYFDDGASGPDNGWYINGDLGAGKVDTSALLKAGRAFVVRKGSGSPSSVEWTTVLPYSLP